MAHCFIIDFAGGTAAQYDAVITDMQLGGRLPAGALFHGAGAPDERSWRVIDVWESPEAFGRFTEDTIGPLTARHGLGTPQITSFPAHEQRRGPAEPVTFAHVVRLPGVDAAAFAEMNRRIGDAPPEGLVFHVNGPMDDGWATVGYWTSKAARDRFVAERVMPAMAGGGAPPAIEDLDLYNALTETAAGATAER